MMRENVCHKGEFAAGMPAMDYVLPRLGEVRLLSRPGLASERRGEEPLPGTLVVPQGPVRTTLTVWGYRAPQDDLDCGGWETSETVAEVAISLGWDPSQPGAWVKQITLPVGICRMLQMMERRLRADPAVAGWRMRMVRVR